MYMGFCGALELDRPQLRLFVGEQLHVHVDDLLAEVPLLRLQQLERWRARPYAVAAT